MFNCVQVWVAAIMTSPLRTLISVDLDSHGCLCLMCPHPSPNCMTGESGFHGRRLRMWSPPPLMGRSSDDVGSGGETRGSKERCQCSFPPSWIMRKIASPTFFCASLSCPSPFGLMHTAGSCPGASPEAMDNEGLWGVVGDDLAVNDEVMTVSSPPPVPEAANEVLPPAPVIGEQLALRERAPHPIWCCSPCHWCTMGVSQVDHGDLHKAHEAYLALLQASAANATTPTEAKTMYMQSMKLALMACAYHTKKCNESPENQATFKELQGLGWLPPDEFLSTPGVVFGGTSASAAEPAEQAASSGNAASTKKQKQGIAGGGKMTKKQNGGRNHGLFTTLNADAQSKSASTARSTSRSRRRSCKLCSSGTTGVTCLMKSKAC